MKTDAFFDAQHGSPELPPPLHFRLLRRFELRREDAALALLPGGAALLDLGCGTGEFAARAAARYRSVVATDVSPAVIAEARATRGAPAAGEAALRFEVLDANQPLPFPDGAFDGVVSLSTLQYVLDPEQLLREAARVLRPGGHLLVEVPNLAYLPQRLRLAAGRPPRTSYWRHGIDGGNLHYFTGDLLESLVRGAGLLPRRLTGSGVFAPLRTWWVRLLCGNLFVLAEKPRP